MNDNEAKALAYDLLEGAEVMQAYDDALWIKVDRGSYNALYQHMYPQYFTEE
jgi:hypothetical protein